MPLPKTARAVHLTIEEWRHLDWVEGRLGSTWHARATQLLRDYLRGKEERPSIDRRVAIDEEG